MVGWHVYVWEFSNIWRCCIPTTLGPFPPFCPAHLPTFHDGLPLELALQLIEERTIWGCAFTFCKKLFRLEWLVFVNTQKRKNSQHT